MKIRTIGLADIVLKLDFLLRCVAVGRVGRVCKCVQWSVNTEKTWRGE
jgi:hypothetical protein